ncbi:MAG: hypothetical protein HGN29_02980 [Asgard group archaeon]|nr:hypothetical protein [Asgard group archaeon]
MKKRIIVGIFFTVTFLSSMFFNTWTNAAVYDETTGNKITPQREIVKAFAAPGIMNDTTGFLSRMEYDNSIITDKRFKWQIAKYEKTSNFHITEGDKKIKANDKIIVIIGANPLLQLPDVHSWCLVYVNDVMARYHSNEEHRLAVFKYIQPARINITGYDLSEEINFELLDLVDDDGYINYFDYLEHSLYVDRSMWTFEEKVAIYNYTLITETNNVTEMELTFDKRSGFLNEMDYRVSYINGTGAPAGVNISLVRLHGFGLRYNISTWLIWTPILILTIALIVALRMRLFQRYKLHREAIKLSKRE